MKCTADVYDFEWCNDFVMVIDSDEYLDQIDMKLLESMLKDSPEKVGRIQRRNIFHRNEIEQENWSGLIEFFLKNISITRVEFMSNWWL